MSETIKDQETSSEQGNAGRRRLVRGAVALAPLVLTLRSGGLAAASAGAAVVAFANVDKHGNIVITSTPTGGTAKVGDTCVTNYVTQNGVRISSGDVDSITIGAGTSTPLACGSAKAPQNQNTTIQVAILSSNSVTSL